MQKFLATMWYGSAESRQYGNVYIFVWEYNEVKTVDDFVEKVNYLLFWHLNWMIGVVDEQPDLYLNCNKVLLSSRLILNCFTELAIDEVAINS